MTRRMIGSVLAVVIILSLMVFIAPSAIAQDQLPTIKVMLDGKELVFDVAPVIVNDRTLVPFRKIFESLGMTVSWDSENQIAKGEKEGLVIELPIGKTTAKVNGKDVTLDVPAQLIDDRTLVPLRFVSENSGAKVEWDGTTSTASITSAKEYKNAICDVKNNKKAMVTIVLDDGFLQSGSTYDGLFKKYGLKGTSAMPAKAARNNTSEWLSIIKEGRIDIASHSSTHSMWPVGDPDDQKKIEEEIIGSKKELQTLFPGQEVICFVQPGGTFMDDPGRFAISKDLVMKHYEGMRTSTRGINKQSNIDFYNLRVFGVTAESEHAIGVEAATIKSYDNIVTTGGWLIQMWHGLKVDGGYVPQEPDMADRVFEHLSGLVAADDVEVVFLSEGVKYMKELKNATFIEKSKTETTRVLSLTDTLDNKIFYYPLTLKSEVPSDWKEVTVTQGSAKLDIKTKIVDGVNIVVYDAVPDGGDIELTKKL